jgi:hypothetical protein
MMLGSGSDSSREGESAGFVLVLPTGPDWTNWQKNNAKRYERRVDPVPRVGVAENVPR